MKAIAPLPRRPRGPGGYVIMIRFAADLWDFHPDIESVFISLAEAEAAATLVPETIEVRIYKTHGGNLLRVR